MIVATAGFAAAHDGGGHSPSAVTDSERYELPPVEGPGDPDGGGPLPYTFQAVILESCFPTYPLAGECVDNGGALWQACDNWRNAIAGGRSRFDITCSTQEPYDHMSVDTDPALSLGRLIPIVVAECGPDDSLCGEGTGADGANDGEGLFDINPGPKELQVEACSPGPSSNGITVPSGDVAPDDGNLYSTFGTGDGVVTQAGQTYTTHHRGQESTLPDNVEHIDNVDGDTGGTGIDFSGITYPGDLEGVPHPGIAHLAVFIRGPIHGPSKAPCAASPISTVQGDVVVSLS